MHCLYIDATRTFLKVTCAWVALLLNTFECFLVVKLKLVNDMACDTCLWLGQL